MTRSRPDLVCSWSLKVLAICPCMQRTALLLHMSFINYSFVMQINHSSKFKNFAISPIDCLPEPKRTEFG